jgi:hypothetical protein
VSAGRDGEAANRLAVEQHAPLCGRLAEEQPVPPRKARSLHRRVRQIADELLTVNYGHPSAETGDRLAIKKQYGDAERELGGRCRNAIEAVLLRHLSNVEAEAPPQAEPRSPTYYQPEIWQVEKDVIYASIPAVEAGLEYAKELLAALDRDLGRTTLKNKTWAETIEADIRHMTRTLEMLRACGTNAGGELHTPPRKTQ